MIIRITSYVEAKGFYIRIEKQLKSLVCSIKLPPAKVKPAVKN